MDWDVHWGYDLAFDPRLFACRQKDTNTDLHSNRACLFVHGQLHLFGSGGFKKKNTTKQIPPPKKQGPNSASHRLPPDLPISPGRGHGGFLGRAPGARKPFNAGRSRHLGWCLETSAEGSCRLGCFMVVVGKPFTFCLLWFSGKSPLNCYNIKFCSPSNVNRGFLVRALTF